MLKGLYITASTASVMLVEEVMLGCVFLAASLTDIWYREVPDWFSYALIGFGTLAVLVRSLAASSVSPFLNAVAGFGVAFAVALVMYYTGQWGGGDAKLLMGTGVILGLFNMRFVAFLFYTLCAGAVYGLLWFGFLAWRARRQFVTQWRRRAWQSIPYRRVLWMMNIGVLVLALVPVIDPALRVGFIAFVLTVDVVTHLSVFVKAVELIALHKKVKPEDLVEGDWLAKPVVVKDKTVLHPPKLGLEQKHIAYIRAHAQSIPYVIVKEGVPFVPAFLLGWIALLIFGVPI